MSGVQMALLGGKSGGPIAFSASLISTLSGTTGVRSAGFTLVSDGTSTTSRTSGGTGTATCGPWYFPNPTAGVGSFYWCKLTISSQTNTTISGTVNSVISLSGSASWTFTSSGANVEGSGNGTVFIYADSGGTILVASGSVGWDVGFTP